MCQWQAVGRTRKEREIRGGWREGPECREHASSGTWAVLGIGLQLFADGASECEIRDREG